MSCPKSRLFWRSMGKFSSRLPKAVYDAVSDEDFVWCRYWSGSEGSRGAAWEDPEFPPSWRALGDKRKVAGVQWLRPHVSTAITSTSIWLSLSRPSGSTQEIRFFKDASIAWWVKVKDKTLKGLCCDTLSHIFSKSQPFEPFLSLWMEIKSEHPTSEWDMWIYQEIVIDV